MTTTISNFVTIACDSCDKQTTFLQQEENQAIQDNPWLNTVRFIQTMDGRKLGYCSDECEAKAIAAGNHNKLEPKKIVTANNQTQVDMAAKAAQQAADAQAALKAGTAKISLG